MNSTSHFSEEPLCFTAPLFSPSFLPPPRTGHKGGDRTTAMFVGEMSEPDDKSPNSKELSCAPPAMEEWERLMSIDLDASWTFDQIFAADTLNPNSPSALLGLAQPWSPLWTLPDEPPYAGDLDSIVEVVPGQDEETSRPHPFTQLIPKNYLDGSCIIKEKMTQALRYFKESTGEHVLVQVWAPVKSGGRYVLTTSGQPFVLDANSNALHQYRMVSLMYAFSADGDNDGILGLPGRVFQQRSPEWSPNVQYYSSKEYPRLNHALNYNVRGTVALPVFEPSGQACIGVVELIMTSERVNYAHDIYKVCKALEAVNLKSSEILDHPTTQICNEGRQNALAEILKILTVVCETYKLPLAQTWVPCRHQSVLTDCGGGLEKNGSCMGEVCMATTDVAFYVVDAHTWGFREACAEHHLQKGQGVAGRAFATHSSCFCEDITKFCKTEYPLVHYARMFGLASCFAICLRSTHTGNDDYLLEFFFPPVPPDEQQVLLNSVLLTLKNHSKSLRIASGNLLEHAWGSVEIIKTSKDKESIFMSKSLSSPQPDILPNMQFCSDASENTPNGGTVNKPSEAQHHAPIAVNVETDKKEKKRGKAEKIISLEVLQQHFSGSLKDAAKSLGVCPTTMKRICRQHGISRWPSRKINKVTRSLSKLKRVIESVEGADGAFTLSTTISPSSIPIAVGPVSRPPTAVTSNHPIPPMRRPSDSPELNSEFFNHRASESHNQVEHSNQMLDGHVLKDDELAVGQGSKRSSGSREENLGTPPTSHGSCQGSSPCHENELAASPIDDITIPERVPLHPARPGGTSSITIKAKYGIDIIRFRLPLDSGIVKLREEVVKRLKLEEGTYEIKYQDEDREWVLIACDADLLECIEVSRSSGSNIMRLLIHDIIPNIRSSCESLGDC
ncbi:unnamed protein product [Cuscuta epithymum]|uniref:Uncharacterized protein n=1 Tax=Cuscuta epithymum TaxID=186058 RepID=A0AAV0D4G2_9ASTE|nr:unnamed protein product [Cuscuta epithymum]